MTVGAVSRHVRALEARMGAALFLRGSRGLQLTAAGRSFAESARDALDRIAAAAEGVRLRHYRRLSVGVYGFFAARFLLPRWSGLHAAHPELEVDIHTSANPLDLLAGRFDAVILVSDAEPRPGLVTHPLMPIATVPVCAPSILKDGQLDFASTPLLHARPRPDDWRRWLDHAGKTDIVVQGGSSFESLSLTLEAATSGMGAAIAIDGLLGADLEREGLVRAHNVVRPTRRHFALEYEQRMADDAAVAAFASWLRELATPDAPTFDAG